MLPDDVWFWQLRFANEMRNLALEVEQEAVSAMAVPTYFQSADPHADHAGIGVEAWLPQSTVTADWSGWSFAWDAVAETIKAIGPEHCAILCDLLRCIIGNPFRRVSLNHAWLQWNDGTVRKMAQAIYDDRAFDRLPILADALEEAGCNEPAILEHCRQPGEHVRGCWVVDLLLGKE